MYGRARRVWVMDRGIPTEAVLAEMRGSDPPVQYLVVGTPKGRLSRLEEKLLAKPWQEARPGVSVKLLAEDSELYVFAESAERVSKERAMRKRQLKWLWKRLRELAAMEVPREEMLMKLGAARARAPTAWRLVDIEMDKESSMFIYALNRQKLRRIQRREGRYLLPPINRNDPALLWQYYTQLVAVEEAFKNLKGDLAIRHIFHQDERRVEAHIFIAFLAYSSCRSRCSVASMHWHQGLDRAERAREVRRRRDDRCPSADDRRRQLLLTRYTQPEPELRILIQQLRLQLPPQPSPRIATANVPSNPL